MNTMPSVAACIPVSQSVHELNSRQDKNSSLPIANDLWFHWALYFFSRRKQQRRTQRRASKAPTNPMLRRLFNRIRKNQDKPDGGTPESRSTLLWRQAEVAKWYQSPRVQTALALVILSNFVVSAVEAQILPRDGSPETHVFFAFEVGFAVVFTLELAVNLYGSFFWLFWSGPNAGWNIFDVIVVGTSLVAVSLPSVPNVSVFRLFRAFRVFRLFKKIPSLKTICDSILACIPALLMAFLLLALIMGMFCVMAVQFFGDAEPRHFGNFYKSYLSLWQIVTRDSWASDIVRGIVFDDKMPLSFLYFFVFLCIGGWITLNVIVAIVLESYLKHAKKNENQQARSSILLNLVTHSLQTDKLVSMRVDSLNNIVRCMMQCTGSDQIMLDVLRQMDQAGEIDRSSVLIDILASIALPGQHLSSRQQDNNDSEPAGLYPSTREDSQQELELATISKT